MQYYTIQSKALIHQCSAVQAVQQMHYLAIGSVFPLPQEVQMQVQMHYAWSCTQRLVMNIRISGNDIEFFPRCQSVNYTNIQGFNYITSLRNQNNKFNRYVTVSISHSALWGFPFFVSFFQQKNPAYGRHWISRRMGVVATIPKKIPKWQKRTETDMNGHKQTETNRT